MGKKSIRYCKKSYKTLYHSVYNRDNGLGYVFNRNYEYVYTGVSYYREAGAFRWFKYKLINK